MIKLANIGLAAVTAGLTLAPVATASAQSFDKSALQPAQYYYYDRDRDRDRDRFSFGLFLSPRYGYDNDYDDYGYYCRSHWRWSPWQGRWVLVRDCD